MADFSEQIAVSIANSMRFDSTVHDMHRAQESVMQLHDQLDAVQSTLQEQESLNKETRESAQLSIEQAMRLGSELLLRAIAVGKNLTSQASAY